MASARQIEANRRNAHKSSGPKTEQGKQASRFNNLKHGLTAATVVLPCEDSLQYHELRAQILEDFTPENAAEWMLVDQLASAWWRTIRVRKVEGALLNAHTDTLKNKHEVSGCNSEEENIQALGVAFAAHPDITFNNYNRYESSIERAFYRAYDRLQKIIERRKRDGQRKVIQFPVPDSEPVREECPNMGLASFRKSAPAVHASGDASSKSSRTYGRQPVRKSSCLGTCNS
jgi:hypothetical protein